MNDQDDSARTTVEPVAADLPPAVVEAQPAVAAIETEDRRGLISWIRGLLNRDRPTG